MSCIAANCCAAASDEDDADEDDSDEDDADEDAADEREATTAVEDGRALRFAAAASEDDADEDGADEDGRAVRLTKAGKAAGSKKVAFLPGGKPRVSFHWA